MECPRCCLRNPDIAERCDCGYDFATGAIKETYLGHESYEDDAAGLTARDKRSSRDVTYGLVAMGAALLGGIVMHSLGVGIRFTGAMIGLGLVFLVRGVWRGITAP